jgi:hypothetical protein
MNQFKKGLMKKANAKKINPATGGMDYTSGDTTTNQRLMERKKGGSTKLAKLAPPYDKVTRADVLKGRGVFKSGGSAHPGFKAVQSSIAKKQGVSKQAAGAILAASTRNASAAAKRANPRLKRVKG